MVIIIISIMDKIIKEMFYDAIKEIVGGME